MSKKSDYSKKLRTKIWIVRIVDALLMISPLIVFFVLGLMNDEAVITEKVTLVASAMIALILVIMNVLAKTHLRSAIWIMILGIFVAISDIMPLIISLAIATILDEFVFTPILKRWNTKYIASRAMDDRGIA